MGYDALFRWEGNEGARKLLQPHRPRYLDVNPVTYQYTLTTIYAVLTLTRALLADHHCGVCATVLSGVLLHLLPTSPLGMLKKIRIFRDSIQRSAL